MEALSAIVAETPNDTMTLLPLSRTIIEIRPQNDSERAALLERADGVAAVARGRAGDLNRQTAAAAAALSSRRRDRRCGSLHILFLPDGVQLDLSTIDGKPDSVPLRVTGGGGAADGFCQWPAGQAATARRAVLYAGWPGLFAGHGGRLRRRKRERHGAGGRGEFGKRAGADNALIAAAISPNSGFPRATFSLYGPPAFCDGEV